MVFKTIRQRFFHRQCVRDRGRENRHESRSQNQPDIPVIQCDCCFLKTEEDPPMVTVLVDIDTVYKQMVAIPLVNNTPHTSLFSWLCALVMMCHTILAQVFVRVISSMRHALEWLSVVSSTLALHSSQSLSSSASSSWTLTSTFSSSMWMCSEQDPLCTSSQWGVWPFGQ